LPVTAAPFVEAAFCRVAARLPALQSKRATFRQWRDTVYAPTFAALGLHHLDLAVDVLLQHKDAIEKVLRNRNQEVFAPEIDLAPDMTSTCFSWRTLGTLAQYDRSKEKRRDRRMISIGLPATNEGQPSAADRQPPSGSFTPDWAPQSSNHERIVERPIDRVQQGDVVGSRRPTTSPQPNAACEHMEQGKLPPRW